ncbi:MAG: RNA polymerase sigma factor [Pseudomonadales bacterium]|nr:RNA polymerase sigma factor [Pseudomonadales bacterium]
MYFESLDIQSGNKVEAKQVSVMDNRKAMDQFLYSVQKRAFQMARIATGCEQDAMDIVQDAMMGLVKSYSDKPENEWHGLFFKILQSRIYDHYRRGSVKNKIFSWFRAEKHDDEDEGGIDPVQLAADQHGVSPEMKLQLGQATEQVVEAVAALPIRQQQAFLLRLWEGMSVAETAESMGVSEGSVKTHYSRALASLKQRLEGYW